MLNVYIVHEFNYDQRREAMHSAWYSRREAEKELKRLRHVLTQEYRQDMENPAAELPDTDQFEVIEVPFELSCMSFEDREVFDDACSSDNDGE